MIEPPPSEDDIELAEFEAMLAEHERQFDLTLANAMELLELARVKRAGMTMWHAPFDAPPAS